ncbi:MAG: MobC family plasmid mobilization relaxosome protein [Acidobacteria bacterium]|nr:MobC family plasmid mobilization relaxosome protein [Acidobacteriota bacterium]
MRPRHRPAPRLRPRLKRPGAAPCEPPDELRDIDPQQILETRPTSTRTWTAPAAEIERERTRQVARIGNNLNQIARWANAQAAPIDAVEIIVYLIAIEREVARLARFGSERQDGRGPNR